MTETGVTLTITIGDQSLVAVLDAVAVAVIAAAVASATSNKTPASEYLTVAEAAHLLRAKPQRIYDLVSSRRLTRHRDGSRVLLSRAEIEQYLNSNATRRHA